MGVEYYFGGISYVQDLHTAVAMAENLQRQITSPGKRTLSELHSIAVELPRLRRQLPYIALAIEDEANDDKRQSLELCLSEVECVVANIQAAIKFESCLGAANYLLREMRRSRSPNQDQIRIWWDQIQLWVNALDAHAGDPCLELKDSKRLKITRRDLVNWGHNLRSQYRGRLPTFTPRVRPNFDTGAVNSQVNFAIELILQGAGKT